MDNHVLDFGKQLSTAGNNAKYTSPDAQKQFVQCAATVVRKHIVHNELGDGCFSLLIDEARSAGKTEQMAIVIRFVDQTTGRIKGRFLGTIHVKDTCAVTLFDCITSYLNLLDLQIDRCRGHGYGGAANMSGDFNGLQQRIRKISPHAHFIHCFGHRLNLVLVAVAKKTVSVVECLDTVQAIHTTYNLDPGGGCQEFYLKQRCPCASKSVKMSSVQNAQNSSQESSKDDGGVSNNPWVDGEDVISKLPTEREIRAKSHARKTHFREPTTPKSRKKRYVKMRLARKVGARVGNPAGKLSTELKIQLEKKKPPSKRSAPARTSEEIRALPDNTVVEWPKDIKNMDKIPVDRNIQLDVHVREEPCGCSTPCTISECRNEKEGLVCVAKTCSQDSTMCGRRLKHARGLELRVVKGEICLFTTRTIRKGYVVCPYFGKLCVVNPIEQYTIQFKCTDRKNRVVYLRAGSVGSIGRFINHSCGSNTRIEEWIGTKGPLIAIVACRDIKPDEEITTNYGPNQHFYCYCKHDKCVDKGRQDPLVPKPVESRLRSGK
ncbi:unnamed protein product [Phytophthora fragariaefolia]|uniref:Unnamed protein product n=1 Tax=Phytophthora fragariaefolia TaxID=1490495 RepID=A0A9W6XDN8_9STRA|nr:unnamed protein product [Phytophthora fragariaefolia]